MKKLGLLSILSLVMLLIPVLAGAEMKVPEIADNEAGYHVKRFAKNDKLIIETRWTHEKVMEEGRTLIKRKVEATWHLSKTPIPFTEESVMELTDTGLRTLSWKKDSFGDENESWTVDYDWKKMEVRSTWKNRDSGKSKENTLALTADVITGDSFELILRGFPFDKGEGYSTQAKVLNQGESFMKGKVTHRGTATVNTAFGKLETYKIEIDPGILPKITYYLTKKAPHVLVLEEGLEFDGMLPKKANQKLMEFKPEEWVKP